MGRIVVEVMPKPEILDPQGKAVRSALASLGHTQFTDVRQGKRFVLTVEGEVTEADLEAARQAAETLLSNPIIEDVVKVKACGGGQGKCCGGGQQGQDAARGRHAAELPVDQGCGCQKVEN